MCSISTVLNPGAEEWRPAKPAAAPTPPHAAVQLCLFSAPPHHRQLPPHLPWYNHPLFFQGFIPYRQCTQSIPSLYYFTPFSFPATGRFHEAPPASFGGEEKYVGWPEEKVSKEPMVKCRRRNSPRAWEPKRYSIVGEKAPRRRQEWRPRKSDGVVAGSCATHSSPHSSSRPCETLSSSSKTTVMIRNIPNQLRRDFMLEFMDHCCKAYSLEYDFFYLPMDFRKEDNLGYAFVNFTTTGAASKFKRILNNYEWGTMNTRRGLFTSKKICEITWADIQGKQGLVERFRNSVFSCDKLDFLPVVLDPPRNGSKIGLAPPVVVGNLRGGARFPER